MSIPFSCAWVALLVTCAATALPAQSAPVNGQWVVHRLHSGNQPNPTAYEGSVYGQVVALDPGVPWLRIHFTRAALEKGSFLRITSLRDGDVQTLHQEHLEQWEYGTAFFNGNAVLVEIVAAPGSVKNYFEIDKIWAGLPFAAMPETICGQTDDRVPSSNAAVGRLLSSGLGGGCTGWIIDNPVGGVDKCHLSAGHCFPGSAVLQFNVPASSANCNLVHPPAALQFAVNTATMVVVNAGIGNDYAVYRCFANPSTNLTTFQTQNASITLASSAPAVNATVRVTGFGVDGTSANNAGGANNSCSCIGTAGTGQRNQTQQTNSGPMGTASATSANYAVDTCGGNSGSPVFNDATGQAFAIHTNGGCTTTAGTTNSGTIVYQTAVRDAIVSLCGSTSNDDCEGAVAVFDGVNGPIANNGATLSAPSWPCGSGVSSDLWYSYVATCTGPVTFDTCSATRTFDTVLQVFSGACGALTSLGCNDDACGFGSSVTVNVVANNRYYIRVGGYLGAVGQFDLTITGCNSADECAGAIPLRLGSNGLFSNRLATSSAPAFQCGFQAGKDLWFSYDVRCPSIVTFSTCVPGIGFDTVLEVFDGSCGALNRLGCNDDDLGCSQSIRASTLTVGVVSPRTLFVRVGGYNGSTGAFGVSVATVPPNDDCTTAFTVQNGTQGPFCNIGGNDSAPPFSCGYQAGKDVWFTYTATCGGLVTVDTCSGTRNFDTVLEIFDGSCGSLTSLGCNDDACGLGSSLTIPAVVGRTYWIRVGGYNGAAGMFDLTVSCTIPNDECTTAATVVPGVNGPYSNVGATLSLPPWPCGFQTNNDVWFRYVPSSCGAVRFDTCSAARTFDTVLQVFGGSCANLTSLGCNDDACSLGSAVTATLVQGAIYWIRVGGFNAASGSFELTVTPIPGGGTFTRIGVGCGTVRLGASGSPNIGGMVTYSLTGLAGVPFIGLGVPAPSLPLCPPSPCAIQLQYIDVPQAAQLTFTVPCDPVFVGVSFGAQGFDVGASGGCVRPLAVTLTDVIVTTIG
ncbi:MAG: hypothetical protein IPM29_08975 [Planctomycetes bacterium]|nr:hypothetical protein [Planctomycetota bacterium]